MSTLRGYRLLALWHIEQISTMMIVIVPVQFVLSGLLAIGLGFMVPEIDPTTAQYLSTGAPTLAILLIGVVALPQQLSQAKDTGAADFYRTLPVPAPAQIAAQLTPHLITAVPGAVLALVVAARRFDFSLDPSPLAIVALAAVALSGSAIGVVMSAISPSTFVLELMTNVALFFVMLFSPINFPVERLPSWLQSVHDVLPFEPMAGLVRATVTGGATSGADWARVLVWAVASFAISSVLAARRT
ncbi:MAG TPA: ABC transporter permease [Acidimicrobiales bacterium]|nr:ABC transporter permease [Acidimicrobiales bacterium]